MQFIDLKSQYRVLEDRINRRITNVLEHGSYILGPEVQELEAELAKYVGVKHAITCANGTDALQLSMMALDIGPGDAVFCPTFTFFASAEVIALMGATPIFVDSDPRTFNICAVDLKNKVETVTANGELKAKAVVTVDLFGLPADYPQIQEVADQYGLRIIEDAAQGFGGEIDGKRAGSFGDVSTTSFFPAKPLGCYGDGGAVFTDNDEIADLLRSYRVHGKGKDKYDNIRIGLNSRLDTLQAAILLEKLAEFPKELVHRNLAAQEYARVLANKVEVPVTPIGYMSSWAQYTVRSSKREELRELFQSKGIPTVIYYQTCMHQQTAFKHLGYTDNDFPVATKLSKEVFSLPMSGYVDIDKIKSFSF